MSEKPIKENYCKNCEGKGAVPRFRSPKNGRILMWKQCPVCDGLGVDEKPCSYCGEDGHIPIDDNRHEICHVCQGSGVEVSDE